MYKIFIVEDDATICGAIARHVKSWGLEAARAEKFDRVLEEFVAFAPQLVLMDISLPFYNGFHWCAEIRKVSKVPIIFISSAADNMNIVMAMNMGGDDFIAKPFDLSVLTAKIQAVLRRTYDFAGTANLIEHGGAILNIDSASLAVNGEKIELTKNEFRILRLLLEKKGVAVHRDEIIQTLWETESYIDENTLSVNMARLRKKLLESGLAGFIATIKGVGYMVE